MMHTDAIEDIKEERLEIVDDRTFILPQWRNFVLNSAFCAALLIVDTQNWRPILGMWIIALAFTLISERTDS